QRAQRFDLRARGLVGGDHRFAHPAFAAPQVRVVELAREREVDVALLEQAKRLAGVAEAPAFLALPLEDALDLLARERARADQDRADGALAAVEFGALRRRGSELVHGYPACLGSASGALRRCSAS